MDAFKKMALVPADFAVSSSAPVEKQLSNLDTEMSQILSANIPTDMKFKLYMHVLQQHDMLMAEKKMPAKIQLINNVKPKLHRTPVTQTTFVPAAQTNVAATSQQSASQTNAPQTNAPSTSHNVPAFSPSSTFSPELGGTPASPSTPLKSANENPQVPKRKRKKVKTQENFEDYLREKKVLFGSNKELKFKNGRNVPGSNFDKLVDYAQTSSMTKLPPVGWTTFLKRLKSIKMPQDFVGNRRIKLYEGSPESRVQGGQGWMRY